LINYHLSECHCALGLVTHTVTVAADHDRLEGLDKHLLPLLDMDIAELHPCRRSTYVRCGHVRFVMPTSS
jgi:hypothetical protein